MYKKKYHRQYNRQYYKDHKKQLKEHSLEYYRNHKKQQRECQRKYRLEHLEQEKKTHKEYSKKWFKEHSKQTKEYWAKHRHKRRGLGYIPLNESFKGSVRHHIDFECVVYIPNELHNSIRHNIWTGRNIELINDKAFEWLIEHGLTY